MVRQLPSWWRVAVILAEDGMEGTRASPVSILTYENSENFHRDEIIFSSSSIDIDDCIRCSVSSAKKNKPQMASC